MDTPHEAFMGLALEEARKAGQNSEIPIGAVLVSESGLVLASSFNQVISRSDPTAHAEMLAIRKAAQVTRNYRLLNTILYVTIEPCLMCMGAILHARIQKLVFGAPDPKWGAAGSLYDFPADKRMNHHPEVIGGIREAACRKLIQDFFHVLRGKAYSF